MKKIAIVVAMLFSNSVLSHTLPKGYSVHLFADKTQASHYFENWNMPDGDPLQGNTYHWRLDSVPDNVSKPKLSRQTIDCRLFGNKTIKCKKILSEDARDVLLVLEPYESLPTWAHSFTDRAPLVGESSSPYGYHPTELTEGLSKDFTSKEYVDEGLTPEHWEKHRFIRQEVSISPSNSAKRKLRHMRGYSEREIGSDESGLYGLGLSLVSIEQVADGEKIWADLERQAVEGRPIECRDDLSLCVVVIELKYPGIAADERIYAACRSFLDEFQNAEHLTSPFDCRIFGHKINKKRWILAITEIMHYEAGGGGDNGILSLVGINSEAQLRKIIAEAMEEIGLQIHGGPRGPILVGGTGVGLYDEKNHRFTWRDITTVYQKDSTNKAWNLNMAIWVHQSIRNNTNERFVREDLVPYVQDSFIHALETVLTKQCKEVRKEHSGEFPGILCVALHDTHGENKH